MGSGSPRRFVDWEERFVSHDRGSRVVHYYLRDRHGHQCLAVIGTERSLRHMVYVVCDDFLPLVGLDQSTTSAFKWRARREVVDWLSGFLAKTRCSETAFPAGSSLHGLFSSAGTDNSFSHEGADGMDSGQEECRSHRYENDMRKQCSVLKADVMWIGSAWICRKRLRHFHSFQRNGITISVQNFVYVMTEAKDRHIAYVEDLFEDKKLRKKLRVRWFHRTSELACRIPPPAPHVREVFYTSFQQDLSVECVDGVATVLSPEHHDVCTATLPSDTTEQAFVCSRQFDNEGIKPFGIQEVKGYWQQAVLSAAGSAGSRHSSPLSAHGSEEAEMDEEESDLVRLVRRSRTARCSRRRTGLGSKIASRSSGDGAGDGSCLSGEAGGSGSGDPPRRGDRGQNSSHDQELWRYDAGDHIEVLSEDSGLRGCWFKGTVVRRASRRLKVRYDDIISEDGKTELEEWISSCRVSGPCNMGIRIGGRSSIRPCVSDRTPLLRLIEGEVVDAWWNDGWWEGFICGKASSGLVQIFIPGERETVVLKSTDLRVSKEWLNGTWAAIPSYPDLVILLGLSVSQAASVLEDKEGGLKGIVNSGPFVQLGESVDEDRCEAPVKRLRNATVDAADQSHTGHGWRKSIKCGMYVKEESGVAVGGLREQEEQNSSSLTVVPWSPGLRGQTPVRLVLRQLQHESPDDGTSSDVTVCGGSSGNGVSAGLRVTGSGLNTGVGLKWKAGRKRHRQGDLVTSRLDKKAAHPMNGGKDCGTDVLREENSSDGDNVESAHLEDVENVPRWRSGECDDSMKRKRHRKGNDSSLKTLHGSAMGSSLFIGSLPIANLVMSR